MSLLLLILCFYQISGKQFLVDLADSSKKDTKSWGGREESQKKEDAVCFVGAVVRDTEHSVDLPVG